MKKRLIVVLAIVTVLLFSLVGCSQQNSLTGETNKVEKEAGPQNGFATIQEKSRAQADIAYAQTIGVAVMRAFVDGKMSSQEEQEINSSSGIGKVLIENSYMPNIPECKADKTFKFFGSVSPVGEIVVKAGKDLKTAVQIYPKSGQLEAPYDVLNK